MLARRCAAAAALARTRRLSPWRAPAARLSRCSYLSPLDFDATPNERFLFAMNNLVGKPVVVQVKSGKEFEGVLHPCFEEDEWILILVGGILGLFVGVAQLFLLF